MTAGLTGSMAGRVRTGRPIGAGPPMMPNDSDRGGDFDAAMRAWLASQPRDSAKLAIVPPASPSTMEATKNAMAKFQPNNPAL